MKTILLLLTATFTISLYGADPDAKQILEKVDRNMSSQNRIIESEMTIKGRRASRTVKSVTYSVGNQKSFAEYLAPAREQGTKMLKIDNSLWIYSPSTDRTIQISGHMLRQSVMGSDLSYEDLMDDRKLTDIYDAKYSGTEVIDGRGCYVLDLSAKVQDAAYQTQKLWIDSERFIPLKQELFAKSGQLLKRTTFADVKQVQGRWFPMTVFYKDQLKDGDGTEFRIINAKFNQEIPEYIFTKAALKR